MRIYHSKRLAQAQKKTVAAPDGTTIAYQVLGENHETLVLANGLGGRLYAWEPILDRFASKYRIITWDYRGLFDSRTKDFTRLSIRDHAEDVRAVLDAEKVGKATLIGWSMGVQVILEFAHLHPDLTRSLILINGTYGHAFSTSFQPVFHLPAIDRAFHRLIGYFKNNTASRERLISLLNNPTAVAWVGSVVSSIRKNPRIADALRQYMDDVLGPDFPNFLHLFQELDAHSAFHYLPEITNKALLISGGLDFLTPARQSRLMAKRMPHAEAFHIPLGTHFVLLEYPDAVTKRIAAFLKSP